jgi:ATP-dependent helicase HrpB
VVPDSVPSAPPTGLPVEAAVPDLRAALASPPGAAVLHAPPGAGKTTVVPLRLLDEPWLGGGRIVVLEPRRLATRAAARRMADLVGEPVGGLVGYRTRDERVVSDRTRVEVVTEGILTRRLQRDPSLAGTGLVVFDELHERNLVTDLGLALLLDARPALRPDLRVLAMSATLDVERVAGLLGGDGPAPPVVATEGREHPVAIRWAPPPPRTRPAEAVAGVVGRALRETDGDVLVFLPGAADIRRVQDRLGGSVGPEVDVLPLHGSLPVDAQDRALAPSAPGRRRVVLSTDIAETSLTVDGVSVVVDSGLARRPSFDARTGMSALVTGPISRASADQRAGRAGRLGPGSAYRAWSKLEHGARRPFSPPEIASADLAPLALELAVWGADVGSLPWLDPPPPRALDEAYALLRSLGAVHDDGRATDVGRSMAELPVHPRLAHMVVWAAGDGRGALACVLAALLEERDVLRGRPDEVPVDLAERVRLVVDDAASHPGADRRALATVRRRAAELARRAGADGREPLRLDQVGAVLALAYPDRVAQARGGGRFRLRAGAGAWVPAGDELAGEAFLVAADVDADRRGDGRVRRAAALDADDVIAALGDDVECTATLEWDEGRDDLRARVEHRVDGLVLGERDGPAAPGPDTESALLERVRATRLAVLGWTPAASALRARLAFLHRLAPEAWPDVSDDALLASLPSWLAPRVAGASSRADLAGVDLRRALLGLVDPARVGELDRLAPPSVTLPSGRSVEVDYDEEPSIAARAQDLYGLTAHPTVAGGRVPLVVMVLSPADRPIQVTADLPGFWAGSWAQVRADMAGRYPKHHWPDDPATAEPRRR